MLITVTSNRGGKLHYQCQMRLKVVLLSFWVQLSQETSMTASHNWHDCLRVGMCATIWYWRKSSPRNDQKL